LPFATRRLDLSFVTDTGMTAPQADDSASVNAPEVPTEGGVSEDAVRLALRRVKDPEVNMNIVDMGLIYTVAVAGDDVSVDMSLTSPGCPSGPEIMHDAEEQLRAIPGVGHVAVNLVWSPPWTPDRIEPRVRAYLGF
jgi:metal-sulfur cluster biosynthetic enzyme